MSDIVWNLFVELRKEPMESKKIRLQVMGFKITFVTAMISLMANKLDSIDIEPMLRTQGQLSVEFVLWQEFLTEPKHIRIWLFMEISDLQC